MQGTKPNDYFRNALLSALLNVVYAVGNLLIGIYEGSWWFVNIGLYHLILSVTRGFVIYQEKKENGAFASRRAGFLLMLTAFPFIGIVVISSIQDTATKFHKIVMITIALYAFSKITLATVNAFKARKRKNLTERALRRITLADAFVSIASLQRSMLVSFEGMTPIEIRIFNIVTGFAVSMILFSLGLSLTKKALSTENGTESP